MASLISVIVPAHNEGPHIQGTLDSIVKTRTTGSDLEIVVVDDASDDGGCERLAIDAPGVELNVVRTLERGGIARTRNAGALAAKGDLLVITDAHVRFSRGWDAVVQERLTSDGIVLAGTIAYSQPPFAGFGCSLVVPWMGTRWNTSPPDGVGEVHVASSAATAVTRGWLVALGGYDEGMLTYGGAEPEFSVRCWLAGATVLSVPEFVILHRFKPRIERLEFLNKVRPLLVHNSLRFGLLYLNDAASLQMMRYYAMLYPEHVEWALPMLDASDVWKRRDELRSTLPFDFEWLVSRFNIRDHLGGPLPQRELARP